MDCHTLPGPQGALGTQVGAPIRDAVAVWSKGPSRPAARTGETRTCLVKVNVDVLSIHHPCSKRPSQKEMLHRPHVGSTRSAPAQTVGA